MKRVVLAVLLLAVVAPATARAATPCRNRIYNDWYADGKVGTNYPIKCYRDALAHIRTDLRTYSSLSDDIRAAMQGALERRRGHKDVPNQIGKTSLAPVSDTLRVPTTTTTATAPAPAPVSDHDRTPPPTTTVASAPVASSGGGVPTPILVLGGLALLLMAVGAVGAGVRRHRR